MLRFFYFRIFRGEKSVTPESEWARKCVWQNTRLPVRPGRQIKIGGPTLGSAPTGAAAGERSVVGGTPSPVRPAPSVP